MPSPHLIANRRYAILACIRDGAYGPEIRKRLADVWPTSFTTKTFGGEVAKLQHAGLVRSAAHHGTALRVSWYTLTEEGQQFLRSHAAVLTALTRAAKRGDPATASSEARVDLQGFSAALTLIEVRAKHHPEGPIRDALLATIEHLERMRPVLGGARQVGTEIHEKGSDRD